MPDHVQNADHAPCPSLSTVICSAERCTAGVSSVASAERCAQRVSFGFAIPHRAHFVSCKFESLLSLSDRLEAIMHSILDLRCCRHPHPAFSGSNIRNRTVTSRTQALGCSACAAGPTAAPAAEDLRPSNMLLVKAVEALFSIKPIFARASAAVRHCSTNVHACMHACCPSSCGSTAFATSMLS